MSWQLTRQQVLVDSWASVSHFVPQIQSVDLAGMASQAAVFPFDILSIVLYVLYSERAVH